MAELAACPLSELRRIAEDAGLSDQGSRSFTYGHLGPSELMPNRSPGNRTRPGICQVCTKGNLPRYGESVRYVQILAALRARPREG